MKCEDLGGRCLDVEITRRIFHMIYDQVTKRTGQEKPPALDLQSCTDLHDEMLYSYAVRIYNAKLNANSDYGITGYHF